MGALTSKVLVLNRSYLATGVCAVKDALKLSFEDVCHILDKDWNSYDFESWQKLKVKKNEESIGTVKTQIKVPRVIRLLDFNKVPNRVVKFNRTNVILRDSFTCQYCNEKKEIKHLNLDHVVPRAQGGETTWENIVTSCIECNTKKADRTPSEAGLELAGVPFKPNWTYVQVLGKKGLIYEEWLPFLGVLGIDEDKRVQS